MVGKNKKHRMTCNGRARGRLHPPSRADLGYRFRTRPEVSIAGGEAVQSFSCFDGLSKPRFDDEPDEEPDAPDEPAELPNVTPSFVAVC